MERNLIESGVIQNTSSASWLDYKIASIKSPSYFKNNFKPSIRYSNCRMIRDKVKTWRIPNNNNCIIRRACLHKQIFYSQINTIFALPAGQDADCKDDSGHQDDNANQRGTKDDKGLRREPALFPGEPNNCIQTKRRGYPPDGLERSPCMEEGATPARERKDERHCDEEQHPCQRGNADTDIIAELPQADEDERE